MKEEQWIKRVREQLRNHSEPLPASGWERLEKELQRMDAGGEIMRKETTDKGKIRPMVFYRRWPAVAAILLLALLSGTFLWLTEEMPDEVRMAALPSLPVEEERTMQESGETSGQENTARTEEAGETGAAGETTPYRINRGTDASLTAVVQEIRSESDGQDEKALPGVPGDAENHVQEETSVQKEELVRETSPRREETPGKNVRASNRENLYASTVRSHRHSPRWSVGLSVGNAGGTSNALPGDAPIMDAGNSYMSDMLFNTDQALVPGPMIPKKREVVDASHRLPLSFGFSVRCSVSRRWSVETGLTYTYMASDLLYTDSREEVGQRLHYVGIPLRASWEAVRKDAFTFYVSAGGAVEKCVYATQGSEHFTVKPLQFSLTGAVGVQYDLSRHVGLYIEPGVSHYFDDGSDVVTYRKENPTGFSLQGGIRLKY